MQPTAVAVAVAVVAAAEEAAEEAADAAAAAAFAAIAAAGGGLCRFVAAPQVEEARERALKVDALEAVDEAREGAGGLVAHVFQEVADRAILGKKFARPVPQGLSHLAPVGVVPPERRVPRERLRESGGGEGVDEGRRERVGVLARRVAPALREEHGEVFAGRGGDPRDEAARLWAAGDEQARGCALWVEHGDSPREFLHLRGGRGRSREGEELGARGPRAQGLPISYQKRKPEQPPVSSGSCRVTSALTC